MRCRVNPMNTHNHIFRNRDIAANREVTGKLLFGSRYGIMNLSRNVDGLAPNILSNVVHNRVNYSTKYTCRSNLPAVRPLKLCCPSSAITDTINNRICRVKSIAQSISQANLPEDAG